MTSQDYLKAMGCFEPDPFMKGRVRAAVERPGKRRTARPLRAAAIAACLVLALVGTAVGGQVLHVRMMEEANGRVSLAGGMAFFLVETLSDEMKALDGRDYSTLLPFDSWEEMEAFIGMDLMNNPVLDAAAAGDANPAGGNGFSPDYNQFELRADPDLIGIDAIGRYKVGKVNITVEAKLYTDRFDPREFADFFGEDWQERFLIIEDNFLSKYDQMIKEHYVTPSGLEAELIGLGGCIYRFRDQYYAAFSLNGVIIFVTAYDYRLDNAREALIQVLDGFTV